MARDVVAEIVAYQRPLLDESRRVLDEAGEDVTREAVGRKLDALARSPFSFFRGTFHLMAFDLLQGRVPGATAAAPDGLIVGDLHLENFGVYRGTSETLCFDVNDFDDVGYGPVDLDLKRLCTSALLLPGLGQTARLNAARALARSWAEALGRIGGRFPVAPYDAAKAEPPVSGLLAEHGKRTREAQIAKAAPDKGQRQLRDSAAPRKFARVGKSWVAVVQRSLDEYLESLKQLKVDVSHTWDVLDVAYRFKGTGSLGRLRFQALLGRGDERRIVELKEARPCALDEAKGRQPPPERARVQTASIRRLQGDPWPRVAGTHLGKASALCREIQPEEEKLSSDTFAAGQGDAAHALLQSYARQCGEVTARLHCRENAPLLLDDAEFSATDCARAAVDFAVRYAAQVEADQKAFARARPEVGRALGLKSEP
jgi:uncharacterized protein (DUF2252 family)